MIECSVSIPCFILVFQLCALKRQASNNIAPYFGLTDVVRELCWFASHVAFFLEFVFLTLSPGTFFVTYTDTSETGVTCLFIPDLCPHLFFAALFPIPSLKLLPSWFEMRKSEKDRFCHIIKKE